jgi:tetratricopeptide (TPR) repeat protein
MEMNNQPASEEKRKKAAELYAEALEREAQGDYEGAIESYRQSLQLYEDETVKAAFFKLVATVGPQ